MSKKQILEKAALTLNAAKTYIKYFDGTERYGY